VAGQQQRRQHLPQQQGGQHERDHGPQSGQPGIGDKRQDEQAQKQALQAQPPVVLGHGGNDFPIV
jgi:hypothetical protein